MKYPVHINGAGLQGLVLGYRLKKANIPFLIHERGDRYGGWIDDFTQEGFFFEMGPRGFRPNGKGVQTLELIRELGLEKELICANPEAKRRYILHQGKLKESRLFFLPMIKALLRDLAAKKGTSQDESVADFFLRRIGKEAVDLFIDPLVTGIYAGAPEALSMKASFPELFHLEKKHRSLFLGKLFSKGSPKDPVFAKSPLVTMKRGMRSLVEALYREVEPQVRFSSTHPEGISCHADPSFAKASLALLHIGYYDRPPPYPGFGYLVPSREKENILGVVFDSIAFPEQSRRSSELRMTIMVGGTRRKELANASEDALYEIACDALNRHLGLPKPDFFHVSRALDAIAQIPVGAIGDAAGINQVVDCALQKFRFCL